MALSEYELRRRVLIADSDVQRIAKYRQDLFLGQDLEVDANTSSALMDLNEGHMALRIMVVDEQVESPHCPRNRLLEEAIRRKIPSIWVTSDLDFDKRNRLSLPAGVEVITHEQAPQMIIGIMGLAGNEAFKI